MNRGERTPLGCEIDELRMELTTLRSVCRDLLDKHIVLKSQVDLLEGQVQGGQEQCSKSFGRLEMEMDMLQEQVFPPSWRDRLFLWWWSWRHKGEKEDDGEAI